MGGQHSHDLFTPPPVIMQSIIHRASPAVKFAVMLVLVVGISLMPRTLWPWLTLPAILLILVAAASGISWKKLARRMFFLEPFVLGVALMALFAPVGGAGGVGGQNGAGVGAAGSLNAWPARWEMFAFLVARCSLALLAMILFSETTPFADILRIFRRLHVPALLVTTLALMHRYIFVLADESARMQRARASRTFIPRYKSPGKQWHTLSTVIGQLFLRASERADRIYDAMRARGWSSGGPSDE